MRLSPEEIALTRHLAEEGYGWENICFRLSVTNPLARIEIRKLVLGLKTKNLPHIPMLERARKNRQRKPAAVRSAAPITLPTVSICEND